MADQETDKQLDELLESLLSQYSDAQPRLGLETRILARIAESRAQSSARRGLHWLWAGAAAAVITAILLLTFSLRPERRSEGPQNTAHTQLQIPPAPSVGPVSGKRGQQPRAVARQKKAMRIGQVAAVEIKKEVFPTPEPLSEQEKLLLRYLARTPAEELLAQSHPDPLPDEKSPLDVPGLFPGLSTQRFSNR